MRKKALRKDFHMEIKKSKNRFLSIFFIVALGVAFFSGIQSSAPDMRLTGDSYFDDSNLLDLRVISTLGLTDKDLEALGSVEGVSFVLGSYMEDVYCGEGDAREVLHVEALPEGINELTPAAGSLPGRGDECFLDAAYALKLGYQPGDQLEITVSSEEDSSLKYRTFTVSGYGYSPCYISFNRGSTSLGTGSLAGFMYVPEEGFDTDIYSVAYLKVDGAKEQTEFTDAYDDLIAEVNDRVEAIADARCEIRYDEVMETAQSELDDAKQEVEDGKKELEDAKQELADGKEEAESELAEARSELEDGEQELEDGKQELADAQQEIADGEQEIADGEQELEENAATLADGQSQIAGARDTLNAGEAEYRSGLKEYNSETAKAKKQLADAQKELDAGKKQLKQGRKEYEKNLAVFQDGQKQLAAAEQELAGQQALYDEGLAKFEEGKAQYEAGVQQLAGGRAAYQAAEGQLQAQLGQYQETMAGLQAASDAAKQAQLECSARVEQNRESAGAQAGQLTAAREALAELERGLPEARRVLEELQGQLPGEQSRLEELRGQLSSAEGELANLNGAWETAKSELAGLEGSLAAARDTHEILKKQYEDLVNNPEYEENPEEPDSQVLTPEYQNRLTQAQQAAEAQGTVVADLENQVNGKTAEAASLEQQAGAKQDEVAGLQSQAETQSAAVAGLSGQIDTQSTAVQAAEEGIQERNGEISSLTQSLAALEQEYNDTLLPELQQKTQAAAVAEGTLSAAAEQSAESKAQLDAAVQELAEQKKALDDTEALLGQTKQEIDAKETELATAGQQLAAGWEELNRQKAQAEAGEQELAKAQETLEASEKELEKGQKQIDEGYEELAKAQKELSSARRELDSGWAQLEASQSQVSDGERQLEDGRRQLADARSELADAKQQILDAQKEIEENEQKLKDGWEDYEEGKKEAEEEIAEGEQKIRDAEVDLADAEQQIKDAEQEIADLRYPEWYVDDRNALPEHTGFGENAERLSNIAKVVPILFFLVAALISLTTMTRMVEEERTQIGTLKALGYSKTAIAGKYLKYALLATLGGGVAGILIGEKIFPWVIINAYGIMYQHIPEILLPYNWNYGLIAMGAALVCTLGATISSCYKELLAVPAQLMRPPAPREGKRVWLEYLPFVWRRLSFTWKSTVRNLFRYKKRFLMTVIGIGGCMGLLLVGYGLLDSITDIGTLQFDELQLYDAMVILDTDASEEELAAVQEAVQADDRVTQSKRFYMQMTDVQTDGRSEKDWSVYLYVPESPEHLDEFVCFRDRETKEPYEMTDEGAILTEKIANELGYKPGDSILLEQEEGEDIAVPIAAVCENYLSHYIYITPALYEKLYGEAPEYNSIFFESGEEQEVIESIGEHLLSQDAVLNVTYTGTLADQIEHMLGAMDVVMIVLIVSAGMLAFVVLYNLNNININERRRELATLKVLGFYNGEVAAYVYRENILLTLIGAALGIFLGRLLHAYVITTVEVDACMFGRNINFPSFVYGTLFTIGFSIIVNGVMYFKLKKIDMVESLKSIE